MATNTYPTTNEFVPTEILDDPVNKLRVSQPQSLIDTDFEYGTQVTKWENISLTNNKPFFHFRPTALSNVTAITMAANGRTVVVNTTTPPPVGTAVNVQDTILPFANGNFVVTAVVAGTSFTYTAKSPNYTAITAIWDSGRTAVYLGNRYRDAQIGGTPTIAVSGTDLKITVTTTVPHGLYPNNEIAITGLIGTNPPNGNFAVASVLSPTQFTYYADAAVGIPATITTSVATTATQATIGSLTTVVAAATNIVVGMSVSGTGIAAGTAVTNISGTTVTLSNPTTAAQAASAITFAASIYARSQSQYLHRPFDGGVIFSTNSASNNVSASRQTRRYFRYQSGKGLQFSSGTLLKPYATTDQMTASGTTVTVTTREPHNLQPGAQILVSGATQTAYNGTFTVATTPRPNKFTYTAGSTPSATPATGDYTVSVIGWYGAKNRLGMFDQQNGVFWEFDGQTLYAVRRSSTLQLSGRISATYGSTSISQTNAEYPTAFAKQLRIGDFITIRGQSYEIVNIASDTSMTISPAYRGPSITYSIASKMVDTKIPQSSFNLDKLDGTGPSGYNMDLSKMQMFYIDYSWYGAGFIRWGVRATNGDIIYAHKLPNNNVNSEAYMRSGNLPGRYETITESPLAQTTATINPADTTITVGSGETNPFPSAGNLLIRNNSTVEAVSYTGKTATQFTGVTRTAAGSATTGVTTTWTNGSVSGTVASATGIMVGQRVISVTANGIPDGAFVTSVVGTTITLSDGVTATNPTLIFVPAGATTAQTFTYSATAPTSVELLYPSFAPSISHWGTSVIMDGRFDDDKSLVFTYGQTAFSNIAAGASKALFSIRVAPSVDNSQIGAFGTRELINRMQLKLNALGISTKTTGANMLVRMYLNSVPSVGTLWTNAVGNAVGFDNSSLAQIADHGTGATTVTSGEVIGGFIVAGTDRLELNTIRDLGNSVLGGGDARANAGIYPDGPDQVTVVVTNLGAAAIDVLGRISWTEAQA